MKRESEDLRKMTERHAEDIIRLDKEDALSHMLGVFVLVSMTCFPKKEPRKRFADEFCASAKRMIDKTEEKFGK